MPMLLALTMLKERCLTAHAAGSVTDSIDAASCLLDHLAVLLLRLRVGASAACGSARSVGVLCSCGTGQLDTVIRDSRSALPTCRLGIVACLPSSWMLVLLVLASSRVVGRGRASSGLFIPCTLGRDHLLNDWIQVSLSEVNNLKVSASWADRKHRRGREFRMLTACR